MKKMMFSMMVFVVMAVSLSTTAYTSEAKNYKSKVGCSCSPACETNQICCPTAGSSCGCFPFSSCP